MLSLCFLGQLGRSNWGGARRGRGFAPRGGACRRYVDGSSSLRRRCLVFLLMRYLQLRMCCCLLVINELTLFSPVELC